MWDRSSRMLFWRSFGDWILAWGLGDAGNWLGDGFEDLGGLLSLNLKVGGCLGAKGEGGWIDAQETSDTRISLARQPIGPEGTCKTNVMIDRKPEGSTRRQTLVKKAS